MKMLKVAFFSATVSLGIFTTEFAQAGTYSAGEFTIDIVGHNYHGCDRKGHCIDLANGVNWRDSGKRGQTWENGDYAYIISWVEGGNSGMYLTVVGKDNKPVLRRKLVPK